MISTKILLRKDRPTKSGKFPLVIRITKTRKSSYVTTGLKLEERFWNESKEKITSAFPNSVSANNLLSDKIYRLNEIAISWEKKGKYYSSKTLKEAFLNNNADSLIEMAENWIDKRFNQNEITYSTYIKYKGIIDKLENCFGTIRIDEFNSHLLEDFNTYLISACKNKINTIASNFSFLRALANMLISTDQMKINDYPFRKWKLTFEETKRKHLNPRQIKSIEQLILPKKSKLDLSRKIFLFCFETGLRIGDALHLKKENFNGTHIIFQTQKTRRFTTLLLTAKAKYLIEELLGESTYLFDFLSSKKQANYISALKEQKSSTALINKNLKIISNRCQFDFVFSTHYARHSMACQALSKGLSLEQIKVILDHQDIKTTQLYARATNSMKENAIKQLQMN